MYSSSITVLDRPLDMQDFQLPKISRQSAHEGDKVISPTYRPPHNSKFYAVFQTILAMQY